MSATITVPLSECDLEMFKSVVDGTIEVDWSFEADDGTQVIVIFTDDKEEE